MTGIRALNGFFIERRTQRIVVFRQQLHVNGLVVFVCFTLCLFIFYGSSSSLEFPFVCVCVLLPLLCVCVIFFCSMIVDERLCFFLLALFPCFHKILCISFSFFYSCLCLFVLWKQSPRALLFTPLGTCRYGQGSKWEDHSKSNPVERAMMY